MPACSINRSLATLSLPLSHSVPSKPSVQFPQSTSLLSTSTISKQNSNVILSDGSFTIAALVEAVSLANASAEATNDAISSALAPQQIGGEDARFGESGMAARRRKRMRKRAKITELYDHSDDDGDPARCLIKGRWSRSERSRCLTRRQEAEFSIYLKVGAMLEDTDSQCATTAGRTEWRGKTDKACLRARECRERITLSYKRLVVSIAMPYQGKGLSLQDLIQVDPMFL